LIGFPLELDVELPRADEEDDDEDDEEFPPPLVLEQPARATTVPAPAAFTNDRLDGPAGPPAVLLSSVR